MLPFKSLCCKAFCTIKFLCLSLLRMLLESQHMLSTIRGQTFAKSALFTTRAPSLRQYKVKKKKKRRVYRKQSQKLVYKCWKTCNQNLLRNARKMIFSEAAKNTLLPVCRRAAQHSATRMTQAFFRKHDGLTFRFSKMLLCQLQLFNLLPLEHIGCVLKKMKKGISKVCLPLPHSWHGKKCLLLWRADI